MIEPDIENKLTKEEFLCFLLIYASHIDYVFSEAEKKFILHRIPSKVFNKMEILFHSKGDFACLQLILAHKKYYYINSNQLEGIIEMLHDIFKVDGEYSRIEKNFLPFFLKMIEMDRDES